MKKDLHISIPAELLDWIKDYRFEQRINSVNLTIRQILEEKRDAVEKGKSTHEKN